MTNIITDRFGRTARQWLDGKIRELTRDAVLMYEITEGGRSDFRLEGPDLDNFVRHALLAIMQSGGRPVVSRQREDGTFSPIEPDPRYCGPANQIAETIFNEWVDAGRPVLDMGDWHTFSKVGLEYGDLANAP